MINITDTEPDFINEEGVKWWVDKSTTDYAQRKDSKGITLDIICYVIDRPDGYRTRVLIEEGNIIDDNTSLEAIACKIDMLKLIKCRGKE